MAKETLRNFHGDFDAYVACKARLLAETVYEVARKHGVTPQQALDEMVKASADHARAMRRDRLARSN